MQFEKVLRALASSGAIAALATTAAAQNVAVYGLLDLSVNRTQPPGGDGVNGVDSGKMTTSYFGFRGDEDLGDGLRALFVMESFVRLNSGDIGRFNGDPFFARNSFVGLSSPNLGTLVAGRSSTSLFLQTLNFNAFGDSFGYSPAIRHVFTSGTVTGDTAWSDSVRYSSQKFGGFGVALQGALGQGDGGNNSAVSASYGAGPLAGGFTWQTVKKGAKVDDTTAWQLAASYDFGPVKAFGQYTKVDNDTKARQYKLADLGATVPVGDLGRVMAQWGRIDPDAGAKRKTLSLGYDYLLSKRTDVWVAFMNDKIDTTGSGNNYGIGMRHRF